MSSLLEKQRIENSKPKQVSKQLSMGNFNEDEHKRFDKISCSIISKIGKPLSKKRIFLLLMEDAEQKYCNDVIPYTEPVMEEMEDDYQDYDLSGMDDNIKTEEVSGTFRGWIGD